jgi:hypothetical protein
MDYSESRSLGSFRPQRRPQLRGSRSAELIAICRALPGCDRFNTQGVSCRRFGPYNTKRLRRRFNVSAEAPASLAPINVAPRRRLLLLSHIVAVAPWPPWSSMKSKQLPFWNAVSIVALTVVTGIVVAYVALLIVASP